MTRLTHFDEKRLKNRFRVRQHRNNKYIKKIYNDKVDERIRKLSFQQIECYATSGSDDEEPDIDKATDLKDKLRVWVVNHRITRTAVNDLLLILISAGFCLPKDARTLMCTPVKVTINWLSNGKLWYYGVWKCLENVLSNIRRDITATLDFNVDGLPISKSSSMQFWPILMTIQGTFCFGVDIYIEHVHFNDYNQQKK